MNVLFMSEQFYPHGGGAEFATYLHAGLLTQKGHDVVVITNQFPGEPSVSNENGIKTLRLPMFRRDGSPKYSAMMRLDLLLSSPVRKLISWSDVVYVPRFWFSAINMSRAYGKPVVTHLHDFIPVCPLSNLYNASKKVNCEPAGSLGCTQCVYLWEKLRGESTSKAMASALLNTLLRNNFRRTIGSSDAVICASKTQRDEILRIDPSFTSKTYVIYNPLPDLDIDELRGRDFGYFGGFNYLKGFQVLYKALKYLDSMGINIRVHATKFPAGRYQRSLSRYGLVTYPRLDRGKLRELYEQVFCVVVPSIWRETFSYVVVESLLRGRAVIASSIGAIPEVVEGCDGVYLFQSGDHEELGRLMLNAEDLDARALEGWSAHNRQILKRRFDSGAIANTFDRVITQLQR